MAKLQFATLSNLQEFLNLHNVQIDSKISEAVKSSIKTVSQSEDGYTLYFYTKTAPVTIDEAAFTITIPQPTGKADKVKGAVKGHLAGLDENGNLVDSGKTAADFDAAGAANTANKLSTPRKIGNASFDGTADITLSQMGLNVPVEITKANYLAKKKAGTLNANTYYNVIDEYDSANVINDSSVTANSAFSSTKSEKTYAKKSTLVNTTLTASKWTGSSAPYSYVLSVSGVTSSNIVEIDYASNASSAAIEAYQNAMLADGGQTTNQITIKATEKPTVDIPITIVIRNDL